MPNHTGIVVYLDTLRLLFPPMNTEALFKLRQSLRAHCGRGLIDAFHVRKVGNGMFEVNLQRPVEKMLAKVPTWIEADTCQLVGVDVAQDYTAASASAIRQLRASMDRLMVQRNRRQVRISLIDRQYRRGSFERTEEFQPTRYTQRKSAGRNTVTYSDLPSKVTHQPCVHVEARIRGSQALRRLNILPHNLPRLADPIEQQRIVARVVRFVSWDMEKIGRAIIATQAKVLKKPVNFANARRVAGVHARLMMYELGEQEITATVISAMCNKLGLRTARLMPAIDISTPGYIHPRPNNKSSQ